jgi:hypothetical protein
MPNTKEFLKILSKGEKDYSQSTHSSLLDKRAEYLEQYADVDNQVLAKQQSDEHVMPFIEALKRKVATLADAPEEGLPIVTRFDLYTGIRGISERAPRDAGLKRLASQLEHTWNQEPMGSLTYGQVSALVRSLRDTFPRSAAADAVEAECARIGMHKLPVAKLARVASKINNQDDYNSVIEMNGLDDNKLEHIRARTFIRSLVAMRSESATDKVVNKLVAQNEEQEFEDREAQAQAPAPAADPSYVSLQKQLNEAYGLSENIDGMLSNAINEASHTGLDSVIQPITDLQFQLDDWKSGLQEVLVNSADTWTSGLTAPTMSQPTKPKPAQPGKPEKQPLTPEEQDIEDAGLKKKRTMDPRTWFASKGEDSIRLARTAAKAADLFEDQETVDLLLKFSGALAELTAQMAPIIPPGRPGLSAPVPPMGDDTVFEGPEIDEVGIPGPEDMQGPDMDVGDGMVDQPEFDMGVDVLEEIDEAADEIVQEAPPQAMDYIQHELDEGSHTAPPGTAEWGAEEVLNEGHEFAPPTEGWLGEEEEELGLQSPGAPLPGIEAPVGPGAIHSDMEMSAKAPPGMEDTVMKLKKEYPGEPEKAFATAWSIYNKKGEFSDPDEFVEKESCDGQGIPLPRGKIKNQPKVTTYARTPSSNGGSTLKAADIEHKLLAGKKLRMGQVTIHINKEDEVELWDREAGRACSIMDLDTAIADFMVMAGLKTAQGVPPPLPESAPAADQSDVLDVHKDVWPEQDIKLQIQELRTQGVPDGEIPTHLMEMGVLGFQEVRPEDINYLNQMVKTGQTGGQAFAVEINYKKGNTFQETNQVRQSFLSMLNKLVPDVKIEDESTGHLAVTIWGLNGGDMDRIASKLQSIGGQVEFKRVAQMAPPTPPSASPSAPAAPAAPGAGAPPPSDGLSTPLSEIISAGMTHYKQMGMSYGAAVSQLRKDYKEREAEIDSPEGGMLLLSIGTQLWTGGVGGGGGPAAGEPSAEPAAPPSQPVMPMSAATKGAQSKMKEPAIRKPKDHVSVPKDVGPDSETKGSIPTPGSIKAQPNKGNHGKMSPKDLGKDSEGEDLLPSPGKITVTHDPKSQPGTKLPSKKLDPDSECKVPFKTPPLKSIPSIKK